MTETFLWAPESTVGPDAMCAVPDGEGDLIMKGLEIMTFLLLCTL